MVMNIFMFIFTALVLMGFVRVRKFRDKFATVFVGISLLVCVLADIFIVITGFKTPS
ncbi:hypothetical protein [Aneurinibacillus terranovensis]|uniref:hypothetical protein n=1 Tax=Aneurinibacillus terranovensis TaxID=278991 RepID=UPI0003FFAE34|nr:hypothetical protein [Aneurinibacillus terranovensis]